jgi:site-specific recombinase XerD
MLPPNKGLKYPATEGICTSQEVKALLAACSKTPAGLRDKAIIATLYRTGLRCNEMANLERSDLSEANLTLRVRRGKGGKDRLVAIDMKTIGLINKSLRKFKSRFLFANSHGDSLNTSYIRHMLKRIATRAEIDHRVHAHGLRHSHAFDLANENVPLHMIKDQLGHSNVATTDRYINHINPKARLERIGGRIW